MFVVPFAILGGFLFAFGFTSLIYPGTPVSSGLAMGLLLGGLLFLCLSTSDWAFGTTAPGPLRKR